MEISKLTYAHFSPKGTTKKVTSLIADTISNNIDEIDFLTTKQNETVFEQSRLLVVGVPVYSGRIPSICIDMLKKLKGSGTPAIAVVTYGNREYEDALLELVNTLEEQNFFVVGAAAFIAEHSIFPEVAHNRPDEKDEAIIKEFANKSLACVKRISDVPFNRIKVKGNPDYREVHPIPLKPSLDATCTNCKACSIICPVNAIPITNIKKTDAEKCISCGACIKVCPTHSRDYRGMIYNMARVKFKKSFSQYKLPELFFIP